MEVKPLTLLIKQKAQELGFYACGISEVKSSSHEPHLLKWLQNKHYGEMHYMNRNVEKRCNPSLLVEGAKSIISVVYNYYQESSELDNSIHKISKYAWGKDYHIYIKEKLFILLDFLKQLHPETQARVFTDSAPVLEKYWAQQSGLGWIGKNTCLIVPKAGSFFFIGEIIINQQLEYDKPHAGMCGACEACINACPTGALEAPYILNANKCISYLTIEHKAHLDIQLKAAFNQYVFGCDICQRVCPWNKFAKPSPSADCQILPQIKGLKISELEDESFKQLYKESPISRISLEKLKDNASID